MNTNNAKYYLCESTGAVEFNIISDAYKSYDKLLNRAKEVYNNDDFSKEYDSLFYLCILEDGSPVMGEFSNIEMEDE